MEFDSEIDVEITGKEFEVIFTEEMLFIDDSDSTQQQSFQVDLTETLFLDDRRSTQQQDFEIPLVEKLEFDSEIDVEITGKEFEVIFTEEMLFIDDNDSTQQQSFQVDLTETLFLDDIDIFRTTRLSHIPK